MKSFLSLVFYLKTECHSSKTAVISCWIESRYPVRQQQTNKKSSTSMERRAIQPGRDWCQDTFNPLPTAVATTRRKEEEEKEKSIAFIWKHSRMDCEKCDSLYEQDGLIQPEIRHNKRSDNKNETRRIALNICVEMNHLFGVSPAGQFIIILLQSLF